MSITVIKRDGRKESLDVSKIHKVIEWACEDLAGVSVSEVELASQISFCDKMTTKDIHETMIRAAADLISEDKPNYQYVAGRLVNYQLRKVVYGKFEPDLLFDHYKRIVDIGYYTPELLEVYSKDEWEELGRYIDHDRDESIVYTGMEQLRGKYLVKSRVNDQFFETPQMAFMLISMVLFQKYEKNRLRWIKDLYDAISTFDISLPTPVMAGVRTPEKQFSSCVLIECDDSKKSISATVDSTINYVAQKAGIGINIGRIRGLKSKVGNGSKVSSGIIPYIKLFQAAVKCTSQGSIRTGSATLYVPFWHQEIEDILVLKNNKGTEENRVRHLDYSIQFNKVMYERLISGGNITLFSPNDVPDLYESFFTDVQTFRELYERYEKNHRIRKTSVKAKDLFEIFMTERKETGRIYLQNVDHCNDHGSFKKELAPIRQSNLCCVAEDTWITVTNKGGEIEETEIRYVTTSDKILSRNIETKEDEWKEVEAVIRTKKNASVIGILSTLGHHLVCTRDHKVYTENRGWIEAENLKSNDTLILRGRYYGNVSKVLEIKTKVDVYDIQVKDNNNFYADGILVHNCEITLPTNPIEHFPNDSESEIALCTLGAVNFGKVRKVEDFEKPCTLLVRALDELLDYQEYPIPAAERATKARRPLGIGFINIAYWMAKNGMTYTNPDLDRVHEIVEGWSYYLIKASIDLAEEKGPCPKNNETLYSDGIFPIHTYKKEVDELVAPMYKMDWGSLIEKAKRVGIRNSTLAAGMPSESSSQLSNSTNGIEPPRALVSIKASKDGSLKQVVPEIARRKNQYELLWDQQSPIGYLKINAVFQKFMDQAISTNTSYNPKFFPDEKIPMSILLEHMLLAYRWGIKCLYYFNTYDGAGELEIKEEECASCTI